MSYHIRAIYENVNKDYTCDTYGLSMDDLVMYKGPETNPDEICGIISFRNKTFIGLEIEKIEGLQ